VDEDDPEADELPVDEDDPEADELPVDEDDPGVHTAFIKA